MNLREGNVFSHVYPSATITHDALHHPLAQAPQTSSGLSTGLFSANFSDEEFIQQRFTTICILNFEP